MSPKMRLSKSAALPVREEVVIVRDTSAIGTLVRQQRHRIGVTQIELAGLANVGPRFIGELERGKPTLEIAKVLRVLDRLGLVLEILSREDVR